MKTVELRAIAILPEGRELVSTGYYVPEGATLSQIREMFANGITTALGTFPVAKVEFDMMEEGE